MPRPKLADTEKLVSFSVRTTQRQMARLERIATADSLPVQDHVRRALDEYMDEMEARYVLPMLPLGTIPGGDYGIGQPEPQDAPEMPPEPLVATGAGGKPVSYMVVPGDPTTALPTSVQVPMGAPMNAPMPIATSVAGLMPEIDDKDE